MNPSENERVLLGVISILHDVLLGQLEGEPVSKIALSFANLAAKLAVAEYGLTMEELSDKITDGEFFTE